MQSLFQTHPYSTNVGILIERVTDSGKLSIDRALILEICDALCETDEGPKEAVRAIRKRLTSSAGKDHLSIWYTLVLLEVCVKNCGKRFQAQVANRDFLRDLIKVLLPKNNPPIQIQTRILSMIKTWVDGAWDVVGRRDLEKVYASLRRKGVHFPTTANNDKTSPPAILKSKPTSGGNSRSMRLSSAFRKLTGASFGSGEVHETLLGNASCSDARFKTLSSPHSPHGSFDSRRPHTQSLRISQPVNTETPEINQNRPNCSTQPHACVHSGPGGRNVTTFHEVGRQPSRHLQLVAVNGINVQNAGNSGQFQHQLALQSSSSPLISSLSYEINQLVPATLGLPSDRTYVDSEGTIRRLSSIQREKLSNDLFVVQTNLHILNDMLTELQPDSISSDDLELLQELNETCRTMHQRVAQFLAQVADDSVTLSLLQLNDELNGAFQRYDRFERYRLRAMRALVSASPTANDKNKPLLAIKQEHNEPSLVGATSHSQTLAITCARESRNNEDEEDDALLDAVAENTQLHQADLRTDATSAHEDLIDILNWQNKQIANSSTTKNEATHPMLLQNISNFESLRLNGELESNLHNRANESNSVHLQKIFGQSVPNVSSSSGGFLVDPLIPVKAHVSKPAPEARRKEQASSKSASDEVVLLFES